MRGSEGKEARPIRAASHSLGRIVRKAARTEPSRPQRWANWFKLFQQGGGFTLLIISGDFWQRSGSAPKGAERSLQTDLQARIKPERGKNGKKEISLCIWVKTCKILWHWMFDPAKISESSFVAGCFFQCEQQNPPWKLKCWRFSRRNSDNKRRHFGLPRLAFYLPLLILPVNYDCLYLTEYYTVDIY